MLCKQCREEVPDEIAIWTQDFNAQLIVFCSAACQEVWVHGQFSLRSKRWEASAISQAIYAPTNGRPN